MHCERLHIQNSKSFNLLKYFETCNCDSYQLVDNEINQQPIITTIRVNCFLQSRKCTQEPDCINTDYGYIMT